MFFFRKEGARPKLRSLSCPCPPVPCPRPPDSSHLNPSRRPLGCHGGRQRCCGRPCGWLAMRRRCTASPSLRRSAFSPCPALSTLPFAPAPLTPEGANHPPLNRSPANLSLWRQLGHPYAPASLGILPAMSTRPTLSSLLRETEHPSSNRTRSLARSPSVCVHGDLGGGVVALWHAGSGSTKDGVASRYA